MATTAKQITVSIPSMDMDVFNTIAKKFGWKTFIEKPKIKRQRSTSFKKSQEDIIAGRINTYRNSDEMFTKLSDVFN
jgi:hypothetical protein